VQKALKSGDAQISSKYSLLVNTISRKMVIDFGFPIATSKNIQIEIKKMIGHLNRELFGASFGFDVITSDFMETHMELTLSKAAKYIDWSTFYRELIDIKKTESTKEFDESSLDETIWSSVYDNSKKTVSAIKYFLKAYRKSYGEQYISEKGRKKLIEKFHPLFVPRFYVIGSVIKDIERGSTDSLSKLMEIIKHPYSLENVPEGWTKPSNVRMPFECNDEDVFSSGDSFIKRVTFFEE